jgi:prepilin-type processing-associated H-X9-DG protein
VYDEPNSNGSIARYFYPRESDILDLSQIPDGAIDETSPSTMNAVGRHHPGKDKKGGTANFAYVDGHVAQDTVLQTLKDRKWGDRFWSITGDNKVNPVERD